MFSLYLAGSQAKNNINTKVWGRFRNFDWTFWTNVRKKIESYSTPGRYEVHSGKRATSLHKQDRRGVNDLTLSNSMKIVQISNRVGEKHLRNM